MSQPTTAATGALAVTGICKEFSGVRVLDNVDFTVAAGSVVGLIGENGAGKSTLSAILAGMHQPNAGHMTLDGVEFAPRNPAESLDQGVALIHQEIRMVPELSVAENIFLGRLPRKHGRVSMAEAHDRAGDALRMLGVDIDPRRQVAGLSMASQQGIEIAKAITRDPRYLIFDEPSASLTQHETDLVLHQIDVLRRRGVGVVYISHRLNEVQTVADEIVCMRDGRVARRWENSDVSQEDMVSAMVGRDFTFDHHAPAPSSSDVVLEVRGLGRHGVFQNIDFTVSRGEILGIAGLVGAGRTEVVRAIAGVDRADVGDVVIEGRTLPRGKVSAAIRAGIVMVPEDRKGQGLNLDRTGGQNIATPWERALRGRSLVTSGWIGSVAQRAARDFDIRGRVDGPVVRLSGGNQQKVLLAKWLVREPKVLILDEPTRGVDVGAKTAIYEIIREVVSRGVAVIVVSSELEEVLGLAHRVLVMSAGGQRCILDRAEATSEAVISLAMPSAPPREAPAPNSGGTGRIHPLTGSRS